MMGASSSSHGGRRYNCNRHRAELRCQSPTTAPADALEQFVTDEFLARYQQGQGRGADATDPAVAETETALDRVRTEYAAWRDDAELRSAIGDADYRAGLIARKAVVSDAERAYGDAVRQSKTDALTVEPGASKVSTWPSAASYCMPASMRSWRDGPPRRIRLSWIASRSSGLAS